MSIEQRLELDTKFRSIGLDRDYSALNLSLEPDIQGWGSDTPIFERVMQAIRPSLVIEIGTWKGGSVIHMAKLSRAYHLDTNFICVDTWLGSNSTLWLTPEFRSSLLLRSGYPSMFRQFIRNLIHFQVQDYVFPLPMTSSCAFFLLRSLGVQPDAVYVDGGHEEDEVYTDLKLYFELLRPGGLIFGDDYIEGWPGVVASVNRFVAERKLPLESGHGKFLFKKAEY